MMKKNYYAFGLILLFVAFMAMETSAQRVVQVAPGVGTLNTAINGDTTATGERVDENTIYELQRGNEAYYGLTGSISNSGYPLTIVAADGDGAKPFLQPRDEGDGSSRAFRPKGDITLKGLHVTNLDQLGGLNERMIRCSAEDIRVTLDDCWFDQELTSLIRVDDPGQSFFITNCVVSNIGQPKSADNGRGIDDRGNDIDTIIIENSTWFNLTSRVIRDDGGTLTYARLNGNTFANIGQMGITFGPVGTVEMKNNLMINAGFIPKDIDNEEWYVLGVDSIGGVAPVVTISNNSAYMDTAKMVGYLTDTTIITPLMNPTLEAILEDSDDPNFNFSIEFTDGPPFNDSILIYMTDPDLDIANTPAWFVPEVPAGGNDIYHLDVYYDFGYVHSRAFVAAQDWKQLGDRRWMADRDVMGVVDFEDPADRPLWGLFANDGDNPEDMDIVMNPDKSGINTSDGVMMYNVLPGADPWAGAWSTANGTMEFTEEMHHMSMLVYKDVISSCALKLEDGTVDPIEVHVTNTVTGQWELLTFDFSAAIGQTFTKLVFFPDFPSERTAGSLSYLDDIQIITKPVGIKNREAMSLMVYPNPAVDQLTVQAEGINDVTIMDVLGKTVKAVQFQGVNNATVSVEDLSEGIYFISINAKGGSKTTKFLKK